MVEVSSLITTFVPNSKHKDIWFVINYLEVTKSWVRWPLFYFIFFKTMTSFICREKNIISHTDRLKDKSLNTEKYTKRKYIEKGSDVNFHKYCIMLKKNII